MTNPNLDPRTLNPTRVRHGVLAFACSLSLITYLDRICIMRARTDIETDLGLSRTDMGLVFAAFSIGYALFEVPGGWMGDRWGSRRVLTRIVLCWSLFTALTGCVLRFSWPLAEPIAVWGTTLTLAFDSLFLLLLVRFLFGAGEAGAYPNLTRVVSDWFPINERASAQGGIWMAARLGGAMAPLVIGSLTRLLGWRQAFWILGVIGIVWAVFFSLWFRNRPKDHPDCNEAERRYIRGNVPQGDHGSGHSWPGFGVLARSLTVWALCSASFWVCFGWYFYPTWQPEYLKEVHHFEPDGYLSEILTGLPFLCGAVGALLGGRLSDVLVVRLGSRRWGRSLVGLGGFIGAGLCVVLTGFTNQAWLAVLLLCLAFLINDLAIPVIWATCADVGGRFAGTVSGLMNMVGAVGAILSPWLIPNALEWLPKTWEPALKWQVIFAGLGFAWFLAAASWLFIDAGRRLEDSANPDGSASV